MRLQDLAWLFICLVILVIIYITTNASKIFAIEIVPFAISLCLYFVSIVLWIMAWIYLIKERFIPSFRLNMKALLGIFAPFGLGGDAIRTYFAKTENISSEKALSTSFVVKFYKFIVMLAFLCFAIYLLSSRTIDFLQYSLLFLSTILMTIAGAIIVILLRLPAFVHFLHHILNWVFVYKFHEQLKRQFLEIRPKDALVLIFLLTLSMFAEMGAVLFAFQSVGQALLLPHIFIFAPIASSLALVTLTPQGIGFVESGGYLVLSLGYFSLSEQVIGSFLIIWSIIRIWIPSLIGLLSFRWKG